MKLFSNYRAYIKDNPEGYWFKRKMYGWGWTPARWEGWAVTLALVAAIIWIAQSAQYITDGNDVWWYLGKIAAVVFLTIAIAWKTGEPPKWTWGPSKKDTDKTK